MSDRPPRETRDDSPNKPPEEWDSADFDERRRLALRARPDDPDQQAEWLRARKDLLWAYRYGYGTEPDERRYFELLKQMTELEQASQTWAKWQLALAYREGIGTEASKKDYVKWMHRAAEDNDLEAMFNLADAYQKGIGVGRDEAQYFSWTRKMAEKGSSIALLNLAEAYRSGIGVQRDEGEFFQNAIKAVELAKEALGIEEATPDFASEDLPKAFQLVAEAYKDGVGARKSDEKYFNYLKLSVEAADEAIVRQIKDDPEQVDALRKALAPLRLELARAYEDGRGVPRNETKAFSLIKSAADADDTASMLKMAGCFETGAGIRKNRKKAFECRRRAATSGDPEGMYRAAIAYGTGIGVKTDAAEFHRLIQEAVRAGHEKAFMALGLAELQLENLIEPSNVSKFLRLFDELRTAVQEIKSRHRLKPEHAPDGIAHFTTLNALHSMLPRAEQRTAEKSSENSNLLRLYNLSYVNDPQEGQILISEEVDATDRIRQFFPVQRDPPLQGGNAKTYDPLPLWGLAFAVYVGSFTLGADRLDLWRAYGRDGEGFSLVTPVNIFVDTQSARDRGFAGLAGVDQPADQVSMTLYRVFYKPGEVRKTLDHLNPFLKSILDERERLCKGNPSGDKIRDRVDLTTRALLSDILYLYKHEEYSSENEVRILAPYAITAQPVCVDEQTPGRLYVKTRPFLFQPESKIIFGPKVKDRIAVRLELKHRLERNGHTGVEVEFSQIPYR